MNRPELSEDECIAEANRRLRDHLDFVKGMRFQAHPEGSTGANIQGVAIEEYMNRIYAEVSNAMQLDFDLQATQRN